MATKPVPLLIAAGIDNNDSEYYAQGRYTSADKVRFVAGQPEKIGGWGKWNNNGDELTAMCRSILCYLDFNYNLWHAFGTSSRLWVFDQNKVRTNITPFIATGTLANPFTTTIGLFTVSVAHAAHRLVVGQYANFSGAAAVGGITISGEYPVTSATDANNYVITHSVAATSSAGPGGGAAVAYNYELAAGNSAITYGGGWGIDKWGSGSWGTFHGASTYVQYQRYWSLDKYGQYFLALPSGGGLYQWNSAVANRAAVVANSPATGLFMFVTSERIVVVLGANGDFMNMAWSDDNDNTIWTPGPANAANTRRLQEGTRMVAGARLAQGVNLVWTDTAAILMQYTGSNSVYATRTLGRDCGLVGPAAFAVHDGIAYWMSGNHFFYYNGAVQKISNSNDIKSIFDDLSLLYRTNTTCHHNIKFREIWWFYPSLAATEPDKYVILNLDDFSWTTGTLSRTVLGNEFLNGTTTVLAVDTSGVIYAHETGTDADGAALDWSLETSYIDLLDGDVSMNIDGYIPDMRRQTGSVALTLTSRDYPEDAAPLETLVTSIPINVGIVDMRHYGRQVKVKISQTGVIGGDFALGKQRIEAGISGGRR